MCLVLWLCSCRWALLLLLGSLLAVSMPCQLGSLREGAVPRCLGSYSNLAACTAGLPPLPY